MIDGIVATEAVEDDSLGVGSAVVVLVSVAALVLLERLDGALVGGIRWGARRLVSRIV